MRYTEMKMFPINFQRFLKIRWTGDEAEIRAYLEDLLSTANSKLSVGNPDHRKTSKGILELIEELYIPKRIMTKKSPSNQLAVSNKGTSWQNANVGWLATTKTFLPSCLPKMKVPGFDSGIK